MHLRWSAGFIGMAFDFEPRFELGIDEQGSFQSLYTAESIGLDSAPLETILTEDRLYYVRVIEQCNDVEPIAGGCTFDYRTSKVKLLQVCRAS